MFERYTEIARRRQKMSTSAGVPLSQECKVTLAFGGEEAERMNQRHIGPHHLLQGLLCRPGHPQAPLGPMAPGMVRSIAGKAVHLTEPGESVAEAELPFGEDCKLVFNFAVEEAAQLGHRGGAKILRNCGVTAAGVRARLKPPPPPADPEQGRSYV